MSKETNYTIMEGYELPSKGKIYSIPVNSHVELRSMTARDEMKRLSPSSTPLKTLADIIEGCMIEKPAISVYDMALCDYEFLLHKLRIVTYGGDYKIGTICPYCTAKIDTSINLEDLTLKEFDCDKFNELKTIILPRSKKTITLKYKTPRIMDETDSQAKELQKKYKDAGIDFNTMIAVTTAVNTVDNEKLSGLELETFINNLPALDLQKLLLAIEEFNSAFGIDTSINLTCPTCGGTIDTFFRFGPEFFRPTNI